MLQAQLKLRPTRTQERTLGHWLWNLTGVWNWAIRKIKLNADNKIYFSAFDFQNLLTGHSTKVGIPSHVMQGTLKQAHTAWQRCFKKIGGEPVMKGVRNRLNSIPFPDPIKAAKGNRIILPGIGSLRFHRQDIPAGKIKCGRIVKRASGWYLCLFIDAKFKPVARVASGSIGIDPGFRSLLALSTGEKIEHPRELEASAKRLASAQRGINRKLVARLHERIARQRKDRNHKLSRRLVSENTLIRFSKDNHLGVAKKFGKSVCSSSHGQLRQMLRYKSSSCGTEYVEVPGRFSTMTCSDCGALTGPKGWAGLEVSFWTCMSCGKLHDRDINAAVNTFNSGAGDGPRKIEGRSLALYRPKTPSIIETGELCI